MSKPNLQLKVLIHLGSKQVEVGELVETNNKIYFKYYPDFQKLGIQISPFKMPLSSQIITAETPIFDGLFGVFNDSLPDGWGRLLLDKALLEEGLSLNETSPLDRLSMVGTNGMGALAYEPQNKTNFRFKKQFELDTIARASQKVLEGASTNIIEELLLMAGSSGGARPKIVVGYHPQKDHIIYGKGDLPDGYEHWIIKFASSLDPIDIAAIEFAYHQMARDAKIEMSDCKLFQGVSGRQYFGTKRFDRRGNKRIHSHSVAGLLHDNFRLSSIDYGHIMDAAFKLENHISAYEKVFRLAAFNVFSHNRDDHSKNISFLMNDKGEWKLAPAYDLTFSFSSHGFHSTTVAGKSRDIKTKDLMKLAKTFSIKRAPEIISQVKEVVNNWPEYSQKNGVTNTSLKMITNALNSLKE